MRLPLGPLVAVGVVLLVVLVGGLTVYLQRSSDDSSQTSGASPATKLDGLTADQLAQQLGCTDDADPAPNVVSCSFNDSYVGVHTFKTQGALDEYAKAATGITVVLVGHNFVVDAPDQDTLIAAQAAVGGSITDGGDD